MKSVTLTIIAVLSLLASGMVVPSDPLSASGPSRQVSPPRDRLVWTELRDGQWDMYVGTADGAERVQITSSPERELNPTWSPDGTRIAYAHGELGDPGIVLGQRDLFVVGLDGQPARQVVAGPVVGWSWGPDSDAIVYSTAAPGPDCSRREVNARVADGRDAWITGVEYPNAFFPAWFRYDELVAITPGHRADDPPQIVTLDSGRSKMEPVNLERMAWRDGILPVLPLGSSPRTRHTAWLADRPGASEEWLVVSWNGADAQPTTPLATLAAAPSYGFNRFRLLTTRYAGCKAPRDALLAWSDNDERLAVIALSPETQARAFNFRFPGILNEPPPGARRSAPQALPALLDPLNLDVQAFEIVVLDLRPNPQPAIRIPYEVLLGAYADTIAETRVNDANGLAREKNLGIASMAWLSDTRLGYGVLKNSPRSTDYAWRFFAYDVMTGERTELLGSGGDSDRAFVDCCGQSPTVGASSEHWAARGSGPGKR